MTISDGWIRAGRVGAVLAAAVATVVLVTANGQAFGPVGFGIDEPRIAVTGLNPHAGESGAIGTEENDIIVPAVLEGGRGPGAPSGVYRIAISCGASRQCSTVRNPTGS